MKRNIILSLLLAAPLFAGAQETTETPAAAPEAAVETPAAPQLRFGYLSYNSVFEKLPEYAEAKKQFEALKAKYEAKIEALEAEKVAACTFTDDQKYTIRLNSEKMAIQKDYDQKLAEATKKAKKFVKKARVLVDDKPQALLNLPESKDYK